MIPFEEREYTFEEAREMKKIVDAAGLKCHECNGELHISPIAKYKLIAYCADHRIDSPQGPAMNFSWTKENGKMVRHGYNPQELEYVLEHKLTGEQFHTLWWGWHKDTIKDGEPCG